MLLSERQLWWGLAVALAIAGVSGVTFALSGVLDSPSYIMLWLSMTAAWALGSAFFAVEPHHRNRWIMAGTLAGLLLFNPIAAFMGSWLLVPASWLPLTVFLFAKRVDVFGRQPE